MEKEKFHEAIIYSVDANQPPVLTEENQAAIRRALQVNHAVGFLAGRYDADLSITHVSSYFLYNMGYTEESFLAFSGGHLRTIFFGDNQSFLEPDRFPNLHGEGEGEILTGDGYPLLVHMYKMDTIDENGERLWILSVQVNEVKENLQLVNQIIHSGSWTLSCDKEGHVIKCFFSHDFRTMLGYHDIIDFPNDLSSWDRAIHPDDKERVVDLLNRSLLDSTGETKFDAEYRMQRSDGTYQWFHDVGDVNRRIDGSPCRMVGIFVNINQRKLAEEEAKKVASLTQRNDALSQLLSGTSQLIDRLTVCDLEHDTYQSYICKSHLIPDTSGAFHDFAAQDMIPKYKPLNQNISWETVCSVPYLNALFAQQKGMYRMEYATYDETTFKSLAISPLAWKDGKLQKVLLMGQDITEEKREEIQARQALQEACDAANRASQAKTDFLSNMSHDIRTPMNAIIGMTAIAGAHIDQKERVQDCLGKITQASRHLLGLINEILDMSRIESGRFALTEDDFSLSDMIDNLIAINQADIDFHHHKLSVHLNHLRHEKVTGDSLRLQQILTNILSNSIKYTPDGGQISISISEIPSLSKEMGCFQFIIEDNGIGMTKEFQEILFQPFTRADDKRTGKVQGTGLGMAIAQNIARMMNGKIDVESKLGQGSRFTITVTLKLQETDMTPLEELIPLPVLVVDDDPVCCESTVRLLKDIGIDGEFVTSGKQAIDIVRARYQQNNNYFAIIIDWQMPKMDGLETTRRIRKIVGPDVTIIILSAYDFSEVEDLAREAGVDTFIAKPLFRSRLVSVLKSLATGNTASAETTTSLDDFSHVDLEGKHILLVEDNALNSEIASEILRMTGADVDTAENGKEALHKFIHSEIHHYDLIFMDIQMPLMNGYEATQAIRMLDRKDALTTPIIAMTANAFSEDILRAKQAGMDEHIAKPLDMKKLYDVLRKYL